MSTEQNRAVSHGENSMVSAEADVFTWLVFGAALAKDNLAGFDGLSTIQLNTKALTMAFALGMLTDAA